MHMTRNWKISLLVLWMVIVWLYLIFWHQDTKADTPTKTDKEIYVEKWAEIGSYKYEEQQAEAKRLEAKAKKDALLQELNWSQEQVEKTEGLE